MFNNDIAEENFSSFQKKLTIVFVLCFSYWMYLVVSSQMSIQFDALGYEKLGSMIYQKGWGEYFRTGPHREPLYPLTIAVSMKIADYFAVSYQLIQKLIQIAILMATQILTLILLKKLKINEIVQLGIVLYIGFSPAIVNSAFSLFSEISTYPFVLLIVYLNILSWQSVFEENRSRVLWLGIANAVTFALISFAKAIFQYVFIIFLFPYMFLVWRSIKQKNKKVFSQAILYLLMTVFVFNLFIISFKAANKICNGNFTFTDRYAELLFGNVFKRTNKMTKRVFLAHLAAVPGSGVCRKFFTEDECRYCEFQMADYYRGVILPPVIEHIPLQEQDAKILSMASERMQKNPIQYMLLTAIESLRMPFWESTHLGFVEYPKFLQLLFDSALLRIGLRFFVSFLTVFSFLYLMYRIGKDRNKLLLQNSGEDIQVCFFIVLMILSYTILNSLFSIVTRYALPIAVPYLVGMAYFIQHQLYRNNKKKN